MSSDLQATITGRDNGASAAIDQSTKAMERLEKQTRKATKEAKDLQREISTNYKKSGEAVSKAGGPLGSLGGRVLSGAGMDGGFGAAAVGFAALSTVWQAMQVVTVENTKSMHALIDAENKLSDARDRGKKTTEDNAKKGFGDADQVRQIVAIGGEVAYKKLGELEKSGVGTGEAVQVLLALMKRFPGQSLEGQSAPGRALQYGTILQSTGMPFGSAVQQLIQGGGLNDPERVHSKAALIYKRFSGQRGDASDLFSNAQEHVAGNRFLNDEENYREIVGRIPGVRRGQSGAVDGRSELAAVVAPIAAELVKLNLANEKQLAALQQIAEINATNASRLWEQVTGRVGTEAGRDVTRFQRGMAVAVTTPEQ